MAESGLKVLLCATGSVAAIKVPELCRRLSDLGHTLRVAATEPSLVFFDPSDLPTVEFSPPLPSKPVLRDSDEWPVGRRFEIGEPVLHIELRRWADVLLMAPLDANTLAKLALGLSDNLITCIYRAWDTGRPIILAPAMNTFMWEHPVTARHLKDLLADHGGEAFTEPGSSLQICDRINTTCPNLRIAPPQHKRLACGDEGIGAMADLEQLIAAVQQSRPHPDGRTSALHVD